MLSRELNNNLSSLVVNWKIPSTFSTLSISATEESENKNILRLSFRNIPTLSNSRNFSSKEIFFTTIYSSEFLDIDSLSKLNKICEKENRKEKFQIFSQFSSVSERHSWFTVGKTKVRIRSMKLIRIESLLKT